MTHCAPLIQIPFALLGDRAFVIFMLALGQRNLALHQMAFPVQFSADTGVALLLNGGKDLGEFPGVEQKLPTAGGLSHNMCAGRVKRSDLGTQEPGFTIVNTDM